jgi:ADP-L-glycero-D-manno-heptose 6-epimerase
MKTLVVTGGGGFIGSNLVAALLTRGTHHIVVVDHFGSGDKWRNLSKHPPFEIIPPEQMFEWLEFNRQHIDAVFHMGGKASTTEKDIDLILKHNFALSIRLWRWCNARTIRLIYASSYSTYGDGTQGFDDNIGMAYMKTLKPMSGYGWSKHVFDMHIAGCAERKEISLPQWAGLKLFNVYGPNEYHKQDQKSVISNIALHALQGGIIRLFRSYNPQYPDGGQKRDVIYVKDVVKVMLWFLDNPSVSGLFNVGTGKATVFNDMAKSISEALGRAPNIHYIDMPEDLVKKYQYFTEAKIDRLRAAGFKDEFTPADVGIKDYIQNYLLKPDPYL